MIEGPVRICGNCVYWGDETDYCPYTMSLYPAFEPGCINHRTASEFDADYKRMVGEEVMNAEKRLKPCPFCGCESATIVDHEDGLGACDYYVACDRCSAMGSFSDNLDDAVRKWNNRVINHGAWERNYMPSPHIECSECGYIIDCSDGSNYCPACGARMDKKE